MKRRKQFLITIVSMLVLLFSMSVTAYAAETIKKIEVKFKVQEEGEEPEITLDSDSHSHITSIRWYDDYDDEWYDSFSDFGDDLDPNATVRGTLRIAADEGYEYDNLDRRSAWKFTGDKSRVSYRSADYNSTEAIFRFYYGPVGGNVELEDVYWDGTVARWDSAKGVDSYTLTLYKGSTRKQVIDNITSNRIDLSSYLTEKGTYYFKVKPVFSDSRIEGKYVESYNSLRVDNPYSGSGSNNNYNNSGNYSYDYNYRNNWKWCSDSRWRYYDANGNAITFGWQKINNVYYYFKDGYMQTGWILDGNQWYYLTASGAMATGLIQDNGRYYYLWPTGNMATGWVAINSQWYFFDRTSGHMLANQYITDNGKNYYLFPDGHMAANQYIGNLYAGPDGSLR